MKKTKTTRISEDLYNLLNNRSKKFGTSFISESDNLVRITEEVSRKMGLDIREVPVESRKDINLNFKKKVFIIK